jgi:hypothetical protein
MRNYATKAYGELEGKELPVTMGRILGGSLRRSGHCGEEISLATAGNPNPTTRSVPTNLSSLLLVRLILSRVLVTKTGFGLVIGFIEHL